MLVSAVAVVALFNLLQQAESWLHQHIFKVGWLVTKNLQTTTILYYTFFLPGVLVYELTRWFMAGILDVKAEGALSFPESQDIAELKLNFVKLHKKTPQWKLFVITSAPPLVGLLLLWFVAVNVFDTPAALAVMQPGTLEAIGAGVAQVVGKGDFFLWAYLMFTISGVTIPNWLVIRDWRRILLAIGVVGGVLLVIGFADEIGAALLPPLLGALNGLSGLFFVMLAINTLGIALFSAIENSIERVTGDSATFKNGKLIAMRRAEIAALREQERQKTVKAAQQKKLPKAALAAGPPSIYRLALTIPGAPGEMPTAQPIQAPLITEAAPPPAIPEPPRREQPDVIPGVAVTVVTPPSDDPAAE
ncbi:MAG: hypothetical protein H7Y11_04710 [Armatimonadetes bacterium]|nr:hypothetical protein [Anaerolineae bacterium]